MRSSSVSLRVLRLLVVAVCLTGALVAVMLHGSSARATEPVAHAASGCADTYPAQRDPSNPLDLATAPGSNPLNGANFFVPGPENGNAAEAIAKLVGLDPANLSPSESWATFDQDLTSGPLHAKLAASPSLARKVALLSKIAAEPQAQRFSSFSWGGTPAGIHKQVLKIFCTNLQADPRTVPIITTYFLHPTLGGNATAAQIRSYMPLFEKRIDAMTEAIARRPAVVLVEIDAIGSSKGIQKAGGLPEWEAALRYEIDKVQALPHTVVYLEGGYSDSNSPGYTAKVLKAVGIHKIRGFFTNDTHDNWTSKEDAWAEKVVRQVGGTHFVVNTASNGEGPKLNPHPMTQGVEDLCNPPGRGLGIPDTTDTGVANADAYLWEHTPGASGGSCHGGPASGDFFPTYAEGLASRANMQLGLGYPSKPY